MLEESWGGKFSSQSTPADLYPFWTHGETTFFASGENCGRRLGKLEWLDEDDAENLALRGLAGRLGLHYVGYYIILLVRGMVQDEQLIIRRQSSVCRVKSFCIIHSLLHPQNSPISKTLILLVARVV